MHDGASFGRWVKQARGILGLTQEVLADRVGCAVQTIRKIEADDRRPSPVMAERLAQALEIPSEEQAAFLRAARIGAPRNVPTRAETAAGALPRERSPLPAYLQHFVGRQSELAELARLLTDPTYRLITLVGAGGMGKTRLAVEAARQQAAGGRPVAFVPLAPIRSAALLTSAIADALGVRFAGSAPPAHQLVNYLRHKDVLLVLDNMEHLLDGVALVTGIIDQAPAVKLLVTSRERLDLHSEWVVDLRGLPVGQAELPDERPDADAVVLFVERAQQVEHAFRLTAENRQVVRRICRLLDGMPLGIELAATWVRVLPCEAIMEELTRSLDFLQATTRDVPERHRSVRAVFEHSWHLLGGEEQQMLRRLTVFRGGFTRSAAEQVAGTSLPVLAALVDKSLVHRVGVERYDLHEVVRQYAAVYLEYDRQEQAAIMDRHCAYFMAFVFEREQPLKSALQPITVAELTVEFDNVRSAWHWAALRQRRADLRQAIPSLFVFYEFRGSFEEAADFFRQAAETLGAVLGIIGEKERQSSEDERLLLGELLANQAWFAFRHGRFDQASDLLQRSLALLDPESTEAALSAALPYLWMLRPGRGDYAEARHLLRQRLHLQRARGDQWGVAGSLFMLGMLAQFQDDHAAGYHLTHEALMLTRTTGDPIATVRILGFAAGAAYAVGAYGEAQHLAEECITLNRETGDSFAMATALNVLGLVAHTQAQYPAARARLEESLTLFQELGDRWSMARAMYNLGHTLRALGAAPGAYQTFLAALEMAMDAQALPSALDALIGLATLLRDQGHAEQAAELCLHVLRYSVGSQGTKDRAEQLWSDLKTTLPQEQVVALEERVRAKSLETVVAELVRDHQELRV